MAGCLDVYASKQSAAVVLFLRHKYLKRNSIVPCLRSLQCSQYSILSILSLKKINEKKQLLPSDKNEICN